MCYNKLTKAQIARKEKFQGFPVKKWVAGFREERNSWGVHWFYFTNKLIGGGEAGVCSAFILAIN